MAQGWHIHLLWGLLIENFLLITDGSAPAERAAHFAACLATCYKAKVLVLHALDPLPESSRLLVG
jgi:nucleotide-binding universal stress UspA family protein